MTPAEFRALALALPGAVEGAHAGHPDFRVGGHVFASLTADESTGMLIVPPAVQARLCDADPDAFTPLKGAWGRQGGTRVSLPAASRTRVAQGLRAAWEHRSEKNRARRKPGKR